MELSTTPHSFIHTATSIKYDEDTIVVSMKSREDNLETTFEGNLSYKKLSSEAKSIFKDLSEV